MRHTPVEDPFVLHCHGDSGRHIGELGGLRLAVKDVFDIAGLPTTAGHPRWPATHTIPTQTNATVASLLNAGARLVGKTITDELAYSLNGQNIHYGTPVVDLTQRRVPGGSSSGSAVAVATHKADIGLGTDTGGSIRVPSSYNGLWGLRPSHGLIPCDNMVALAPSFDTIGWMCRDLRTLTKSATVILPGQDLAANRDNAHEEMLLIPENLLGQAQHKMALSTWLHNNTDALSTEVINLPEDLLGRAGKAFKVLQGREIWHTHGPWITEHKVTFATDIQARIDWCQTLVDEDVIIAQAQQEAIRTEIEGILDQHRVLVIPTTPGFAPSMDESAQVLAAYRDKLLGLTAMAGLCGLPQLHIPITTGGLPAGISLVGRRNGDWQLLNLAARIVDKEKLS